MQAVKLQILFAIFLSIGNMDIFAQNFGAKEFKNLLDLLLLACGAIYGSLRDILSPLCLVAYLLS